MSYPYLSLLNNTKRLFSQFLKLKLCFEYFFLLGLALKTHGWSRHPQCCINSQCHFSSLSMLFPASMLPQLLSGIIVSSHPVTCHIQIPSKYTLFVLLNMPKLTSSQVHSYINRFLGKYVICGKCVYWNFFNLKKYENID